MSAENKMSPIPWSWSLTPNMPEEKDWKAKTRTPADGFHFVERGGVVWHERVVIQ